MLDGRQPTLEAQAAGAIHDHAQGVRAASPQELQRIAEFQQTNAFFSSPALRDFALGGAAPATAQGRTRVGEAGPALLRGLPPDPAAGFKPGLCAHCHSGPLMNQTNEFAPVLHPAADPAGTRFSDVGVSEFNAASNPVREFVFNKRHGERGTRVQPRSGPRADHRHRSDDDPTFENVNAFKISPLRGIRRTRRTSTTTRRRRSKTSRRTTRTSSTW